VHRGSCCRGFQAVEPDNLDSSERSGGRALSVVLRDRDVRPEGSPDYLFKTRSTQGHALTSSFTGSRAMTSKPPPGAGSALTFPP